MAPFLDRETIAALENALALCSQVNVDLEVLLYCMF